MGGKRSLSPRFLAGLGPAQRDRLADSARLDDALGDVVARAQAAWPGVRVAVEAFLPYLAARVGDAAVARPFDDLAVEDLYVACGCAAGDPRAIAALEARYLPEVLAALRRMTLGSVKVDDILQTIRRQLFVGDGTEPPRITQYNGRGHLGAWLRVSAVRAALKLLRKQRHEVLSEDERLIDLQQPGGDPELAHMKRIYRASFKEALGEALSSLSTRERNLLRQHLLDGLNIDELGALYRVHRATAARWLVQARAALLKHTRSSFMKRVRVTGSECDSILRLVQSQADVTLRRLFQQARSSG